jgi:hypothetical protein
MKKVAGSHNFFKGQKEYKEYNLNQGVYNDHFYYGKQVNIQGNLTDCLVFDDGSTATDLEKVLVEQEVVGKDRKTRRKKLPYGENQIKELGMDYRHPLIQQNRAWSNDAISHFIETKNPSVGSVNSVGRKAVPMKIPQNSEYSKKNDTSFIYALHYSTINLTTLTTLQTLGKDLLTSLIKVIERYMDVTDKRALILASSYILITYCYSLFDSVGYLFFNSDKESGKTKFSTLIGLMAFHTVNCSSPTEAALFRVTSLGAGLMVVDDFENISDERKNALLQILKVGYRKDGKVIRVEKRKDAFVPLVFDCYCPKIITNTTSLEPVTLSRCIPIHLMKTLSKKGRSWPDENWDGWQVVRDACHLFVLQNWEQLRQAYKDYECEDLNNRDLELVKGMLAIVKCIDSALHEQLLRYVLACFNDRESVDMSGSWLYLLLSKLRELAPEEGAWFSTTTITEELRYSMVVADGCDNEKDFKAKKGKKLPTTRFVGNTLSKVPSFLKRRVGAGIEYWLSKRLVEDYMKIRGFYLDEPKQKKETVLDDEQQQTLAGSEKEGGGEAEAFEVGADEGVDEEGVKVDWRPIEEGG